MHRIYPLVLAAGLLFCWGTAAPATAQEQTREKREERMEILTMWRMMQELDLDKELADRIYGIRREFLTKRKKLRREIRDEFKKLRKRLKAGPGSLDDKELKSLLDTIRQKRKKLQSLWEEQYEAVSKILPVRQQAKLMLFLKDFKRELRRMRRALRGGQRPGFQRGMRGRPGPPPGGPSGRWDGPPERDALPGQ